MAAHQFGDLPLIPQTIDECLPIWAVDGMHYASPYKQPSFAFAPDQDSFFADFPTGLVSMQPMQRFMVDQCPLTVGMLNVKVPVQDQPTAQFDHWPAADCFRNASPDRTSSSGISSQALQNELRPAHVYSSMAYKGPVDYVQPSMIHSATELFTTGSYLANTPKLDGSITLAELEYEHAPSELESAVEDDTLDLKQEAVCVQETVELKAEETTSDAEYADSGIGNSVRDAESVQPIDPAEDSSDLEWRPKPRSPKRRRSLVCNGSIRAVKRQTHARKDSSVSTASSTSTTPTTPKKTSRRPSKSSTTSPTTTTTTETRRFPCPLAPYGCTSAFNSKNEWKRHVATQHVKTGFWRCDLCGSRTDPDDPSVQYHNDFNRKDLFTQHLRRMHGPASTPGTAAAVATLQAQSQSQSQAQSQSQSPSTPVQVTEHTLPVHQTRCFQALRSAPATASCLFCERVFAGKNAWDERMEHVGRHLEKDRAARTDMLEPGTWRRDEALEAYLLDEGIVERVGGAWRIGKGVRRVEDAVGG